MYSVWWRYCGHRRKRLYRHGDTSWNQVQRWMVMMPWFTWKHRTSAQIRQNVKGSKIRVTDIWKFIISWSLLLCMFANVCNKWDTEYTDGRWPDMYKNRTLTHNLQQPAQEATPLSTVTGAGSQTTICK